MRHEARTPTALNKRSRGRRTRLAFAVGAMCLLGSSPAVTATIDNVATVSGLFNAEVITASSETVRVELAPANQLLTATAVGVIDPSGSGDPSIVDAGDVITYTVTVRNEGNVTISGVAPSLTAVGFAGTPGAGAPGAIAGEGGDMLPGAIREFVAAYTLTAEEVARAAGITDAVSAGFTVSGTGPLGQTEVSGVTALNTIAPSPVLAIVKTAALAKAEGNSAEGAEVGDVITYSYEVRNTGNVTINDITVSDLHEDRTLASTEAVSVAAGPWNETAVTADVLAVSDDSISGTNGSWDVLGPGGAVRFTYEHTVTQAEFDAR